MARPGRTRLTARFYRRTPEVVARALLGKVLMHGQRWGRIVETEAYLGPEDLASHARFGPTERNRSIFGRGGLAYVYLCYGVHEMFNVVTGPEGVPGAALVRALALPSQDPGLARGPGKLTRALGLGRVHDGVDMVTDPRLFVATGRLGGGERVATGPRVGVDYAGAWADRALRFWIAGHPAVSRPRRRDPGGSAGREVSPWPR